MTYLKKKFAEAGELLLNVREHQFVGFTGPIIEDLREFTNYFYTGLLQSKKWHINGNNRWKVVDIHFLEDVYVETVEKILEKNCFTDRRVSLDMEASVIKNLIDHKTDLNKIYRSFQYAYNYNYLFCLTINTSHDELFIQKIKDVRSIFKTTLSQKSTPVYCILMLDDYQLRIINDSTDISINTIVDKIFQIPALSTFEIEIALSEFPLFRESNMHAKNDLIEEIFNSDNILLQLKNAIRKLSVGIMPKSETKGKPLQVKKDQPPKIKVVSNTHIDEIAPVQILKRGGLDEKVHPIDKIYNSMGTRFQQRNFTKIMLACFYLDGNEKINHREIDSKEVTKILNISEKDIFNALKPFSENNLVVFDSEQSLTISFRNTETFFKWNPLKELLDLNKELLPLFEKIRELALILPMEEVMFRLSERESEIIKSKDWDIYTEFYRNSFPAIQEQISLIRDLFNSIGDHSGESVSKDLKIDTENEKSKISISFKKVGNPDEVPFFDKEETTREELILNKEINSEEEIPGELQTEILDTELSYNEKPEDKIDLSELLESTADEDQGEIETDQTEVDPINENESKSQEIILQTELSDEPKKNVFKIKPVIQEGESPSDEAISGRTKLTFKKKD